MGGECDKLSAMLPLERITAMPKLYEYFDLIVMFYANEHEPVHVHGQCQGRESKAGIMVLNGMVTEIRYSEVAGRAPLEFREMKYFQELVTARANDIIQKWIKNGSISSSCTNPSNPNASPGDSHKPAPHQHRCHRIGG